METQSLINAGLGLIAFMGGWILRNLQESMKSLRDSDDKLASKVQAIEVLVAGQYIKREDFDKTVAALFSKLDRIDSKLDNKMSKTDCESLHKKP